MQSITAADLRNLRLGPVAKAAAFDEAKAHDCRTRHGLKLGRADPDGGNRRYDLADAATLLLMRWVNERLGTNWQRASFLANCASDKIRLLTEFQLSAIDYPAVPTPEANFVMLLDRADGSTHPEIWDVRDLKGIERDRIMQITIYLNPLVEYARDQLCEAVGGDCLKLRESMRV